MSDLSRSAAASLLLATIALVQMATDAEAQGFIPDITISSTVPSTNGDVNPYGVAFVPSNFPLGGTIAPGDILVSNFNNAPSTGNPSGLQGTGTTIVQLRPSVVTPPMQASTFFTSTQIGLTTALGVLERGFVVVGNLPNPLSAGSLQFIDRNGTLVLGVVSPPQIDGPWDLTIDDDQVHPTVYVSNVHVQSVTPQGVTLRGTVVRLNLTLSPNSVTLKATVIASGYTTVTDPTAFVLAPTGLAHDRESDILYVASTGDNAIFKVFNASTRNSPPTPSTGTMIATGGQLRGPLALVFAPNGNLITSNGDVVNPDAHHPSEIVELTKGGNFVGQFNVDPAPGGAFGIGVSMVGGGDTERLAVVDDNTNNLMVVNQSVQNAQ